MDAASFFRRVHTIGPSVGVLPVDVGAVIARGRRIATRQALRATVVSVVIGGVLAGAGFGARAIVDPAGEDGDAGTDVTAPVAPASLRAETVGPQEVELTWAAAEDDVAVAGYIVYRDGSRLATVDGATLAYSDATVDAQTAYRYRVRAFDAAGNRSGPSNPVLVTTPERTDTQAPSAPTGLTAEAASATEVLLTWSPSDDDVAVVGYTVLRDGDEVATVDGLTTTFADDGVVGDTAYAYAVEAFDAAGNRSDRSVEVPVATPPPDDVTPPTPPSAVEVTGAEDGWLVSWQPSTDDVGVVGYTVLRDGEEIGTVDGAATSFTDRADLCEGRYSYQIVAFDDAGNVSEPGAAEPLSVVC